MRARRVLRLLLAAALLWVPVSVSATPVVYSFTSGSVTVSASIVSGATITPISLNGSSSLNVLLTGTSVTFDSAVVPGNALPAFSFVTAPTGTLNLSPAVGTITSVSLTALTIGPGGTYTSSVGGLGPYNFNAGAIASSGTISLNGGAFNSFTANTPTASGQINLGVSQLDLNGITLWQRNLGGGARLLVKGDFVFHGIPEPGMAVLIACAGAVLAARLRRR